MKRATTISIIALECISRLFSGQTSSPITDSAPDLVAPHVFSSGRSVNASYDDIMTGAPEMPLLRMVFSNSNNYLLTGGGDGFARMLDIATGREIRSFAAARNVDCMSLSPDEKMIALSSQRQYDKTLPWGIVLRNAASGSELWRTNIEMFCDVQFIADGRFLLGRDPDKSGEVQFLDVKSGLNVGALKGSKTDSFECASATRDGNTLASGANKKIVIWDLVHRRVTWQLEIEERVLGVAISPDGSYLAVRTSLAGSVGRGSEKRNQLDLEIKLWDLRSKKPIGSFLDSDLSPPYFSSEGEFVFVNEPNLRGVKVWNSRTLSEDSNSDYSNSNLISFSRTRSLVAMFNQTDQSIKVVDIKSRQVIQTFKGVLGSVLSIKYLPDNNLLRVSSVVHHK